MRIGIDLGGTKIEAVVLADNGEMVFRHRIPTPGNDYTAVLSALVRLVALVEAEVGPNHTIGIGTPGSPSLLDGRMKNCNSTCLNGRYLQRDVERALRRPVRIANDANCLALSEAVDGAAAGARCVFGVILGTGVGGGLVINGQLLAGASGIGSEWGHNLLPGVGTVFAHQRRPCYCGNTDCIETYLSGPGFARTYRHEAGGDKGVWNKSGGMPEAEAIADLALQGDPLAQASLELYARQLAYALSQVINIVDPDVVVLGGGMSNLASLYTAVPRLWQPWVFSDSIQARLVSAQYGDSSGVRGAAWLWNVSGKAD